MTAISTSTVVFVLFVVPALGFALYLLLHDTLVRIDAGEVGLVEVRGRPTDRVLLPGTHLVVPFGRMTIHPYPTLAEAIRRAADAYNRTRLTPFAKSLSARWLAWQRR